MASLSKELKAKLLKAQSAGEAAALLKAAGEDEALAEQVWAELTRKREADGNELSLDELEAVSGGVKRDWVKDGCAATVGPNSLCGSNDACSWWDVVYEHGPTNSTCPTCGIPLYAEDCELIGGDDVLVRLRCKKCGYMKERW